MICDIEVTAEVLEIFWDKIKNIDPAKIEAVFIENQGNLSTIPDKFLDKLKRIKYLMFVRCQLPQLPNLSAFNQLKFITFDQCSINGFATLGKISSLRGLFFKDCNLKQLPDLSNFHKLEQLFLWGNDLNFLEFPRACP